MIKNVKQILFLMLLLNSCVSPPRPLPQPERKPDFIAETIVDLRETLINGRVCNIHLLTVEGTLVLTTTVRGFINPVNKGDYSAGVYWTTATGEFMQWTGPYLITTETLDPDQDSAFNRPMPDGGIIAARRHR